MGVSWGRAFRAALMIILYSIIWIIVGVVIIFVSIYGSYSTISPYGFPTYNPYYSIGGLVGLVVGLFIIYLGVGASYLKVQTDLMADEVEKRMKSIPPPIQLQK